MGTINHIRVARSNWSIARECEREHLKREKPLGEEFPFWLRGKTNTEKPQERSWNTSKRNICTECFQVKSVNGTCGCDW